MNNISFLAHFPVLSTFTSYVTSHALKRLKTHDKNMIIA